MTRFLLVCLGGALGSGTRFLISSWTFPYGTFLVNAIGSFAIGAVMQLLPDSDTRAFLTAGVLGGFTTYSSFNEETLQLARSGAWSTAVLNITATLVVCLLAGIAGATLARR